MAASKPLGLTQEELHRLFDLRDGVLYWKISAGSRAVVGSVAGNLAPNGYQRIKIGARLYRRSRLVYMYVHGIDSHPNQIDHINRIRNDDRPENLRVVTVSENNSNRGGYGASRHWGVVKHGERWQALVTTEERETRGTRAGFLKRKYLGYFATEQEAAAAVEEWERERRGT